MVEPEASSTRFGDIRWLTEVDSTNRYALDEARAGAAAGLVVVADHQTAGRGRLGRVWVAPPGASLLVSVLLRPDLAPDQRHLVVIAAALAMAEAVHAETGVRAGLKWPNDLLVGDRKLAGILAEASGDAVVVGIGVNLHWEDVPSELAEIATACNLEGGRPTTREAVLAAFLAGYAIRLDDPTGTRADYERGLVTLGRRVRVEQSGGVVTGLARGVDGAGHLLLRCDDGTTATIAVGDVVHVRAEETP
ncbi:MAG: biotin--[acetyl-CoA-carboxylase] ligase [Acidimicrobiia bacterium]|nr:biotin--[acetyl-CoA-carboxylase] ligase [Acidimicrobiia bacterium]